MDKGVRLLAIDVGYSSVKVAYYNEEGVLQFDKYISAIAKIDNPLEADNDVMFRLGVDYYIIGSPALKVPRSALLNLETFDDLKQAYPVFVSYLLETYGKDKFDAVAIGLSMAFQDRAAELLQHLRDTLLIEKDNYFMCFPQGLSCKKVYSEIGLDIRETTKHNDQRMRNYLILDGGFLTCDICNVAAGKAAAGNTIGIPNTGIICITYDIVDYLFKQYQMKASLKEAQAILDSGGVFVRRGKTYDISEKIDEFTKRYLAKVLNLLEDRFSEAIDVVEGILVLGGLAYFFQKYISDPEFIEEVEKHFPTSFIHYPPVDSEYFNAYSYLKLAEQYYQ